MARRAAATLALWLALGAGVVPLGAQWYSPQSDRDLRLRWEAERIGPSRMLIMGEIQNLSGWPASRVVLMAEGLNESGKVVSRARDYLSGTVPPRGSSNFEIRLVLAGSERQYRVTVEFFEFLDPSRAPQSP